MDTTESIMSRLEMIFEENRLESFKKWPYSKKYKCNTQKMAEAGFFWTGTSKNPDSAQCFVCEKSLDGWEKSDDPWMEHKNHSSECPFVLLGKIEEELTLEQFTDLWKQMAKNLARKMYEVNKKKIMEEADAVTQELINFRNKMKSK